MLFLMNKNLLKLIIIICLLFFTINLYSVSAQENSTKDILLNNQNQYLNQIKFDSKSIVPNIYNNGVIVSILDSGIDFDNLDFKKNIIPGINFINNTLLPIDDNGHGTNIAGVISTLANNINGLEIMPIKILNNSGSGTKESLVKGINYAIDHGAQIIVLSLALNSDNKELRDVIQKAEEKNILVVAATGNNNGNFVKYPAAYPTVLAVGGVAEDNKVDTRSNYGPEVDIVAPITAITTVKGGGYKAESGTSISAAEVAGVAVLIKSKYPQMKPYQIRNILQQTSQDIESPGWDTLSGYGMLRVDRALTENYIESNKEPNNIMSQAHVLPVGKMITGNLNNENNMYWYYLDAPYDGEFDIQTQTDKEFDLILFDADSVKQSLIKQSNNHYVFSVKKGRYYLKITSSNDNYQLIAKFNIYKDLYEEKDIKEKAYQLKPENQTITGTFNQINELDWYYVNVDKAGKLNFNLTTNVFGIDPVLMYQKPDEQLVKIDLYTGGQEESTTLDVKPGKYYFAVKNNYENLTIGEYKLKLNFFNMTNPFEDLKDISKDQVRVIVDNKHLIFDYPKALQNEGLYFPLRSVIENIGGNINWDNTTQTAISELNNASLSFKIGEMNIKASNGRVILLDRPIKLIDQMTMVPIENLKEVTNDKMIWDWNEYTNTIVIHNLLNNDISPLNPEHFLSQGHSHDASIISTFKYNSNPPTSGPHLEIFPDKLIVTEPMDIAVLVHMLEHGNVIIAYNQLPDNDLKELKNWVEEKNKFGTSVEAGTSVLLTPWPSLEPNTINALAWTQMYQLKSFSQSDLDLFVATWLANTKNITQ